MEKIEQLRPQFKTSLGKAFKNVEPFNKVHINVALSVSAEGLPARFLAGVIPAFTLARAIQNQFEVATSVRVFTPINLAVNCNREGQPGFEVAGAKVIEQGRMQIQEFKKTHFPTIHWRFVPDLPWNAEAENLLISIWQRTLELNEEQLNLAINTVQDGKPNPHLYIPHHLFGWQDCFSPNIFPGEDKPKDDELVINCMSQSERNFQAFRKRLSWDLQVTKPQLLIARSPIDVITERCPGPHYVRSRDTERIEPSLDDLLSHGFVHIVRSLDKLVKENPKFETAKKDIISVSEFFHQRWIEDPNHPTFDEFIGGIK